FPIPDSEFRIPSPRVPRPESRTTSPEPRFPSPDSFPLRQPEWRLLNIATNPEGDEGGENAGEEDGPPTPARHDERCNAGDEKCEGVCSHRESPKQEALGGDTGTSHMGQVAPHRTWGMDKLYFPLV